VTVYLHHRNIITYVSLQKSTILEAGCYRVHFFKILDLQWLFTNNFLTPRSHLSMQSEWKSWQNNATTFHIRPLHWPLYNWLIYVPCDTVCVWNLLALGSILWKWRVHYLSRRQLRAVIGASDTLRVNVTFILMWFFPFWLLNSCRVMMYHSAVSTCCKTYAAIHWWRALILQLNADTCVRGGRAAASSVGRIVCWWSCYE